MRRHSYVGLAESRPTTGRSLLIILTSATCITTASTHPDASNYIGHNYLDVGIGHDKCCFLRKKQFSRRTKLSFKMQLLMTGKE